MNYKYEFPDFDYEIPELGNGWIDTAWHNDVSPSFEFTTQCGTIYRLWFDYKNPDKREIGGLQHVLSKKINEIESQPLIESDNLNEVLEHFNNLKKV
jgi:hypothetical protein